MSVTKSADSNVERRKSLGTSDVRKARKERDRIVKEISDRRDGRQPEVNHTWRDAVDGCLALLEVQERAGETSAAAVKRYATSIVQITLALGWQADNDATSTPLNEITKGTVTDFVEARREEGRATSTILNDVTAWSHVMGNASQKDWIQENPIRTIERRKLIGNRRSSITPPTDPEVAELIAEVSEWSPDVVRLILWLRQTGMRLAEALNLRATDIHPCGTKATPRLGVKRNRGADGGPMTRTINPAVQPRCFWKCRPKADCSRSCYPTALLSRRVTVSGGDRSRDAKTVLPKQRVGIRSPSNSIGCMICVFRSGVTRRRSRLHLPPLRAPWPHPRVNNRDLSGHLRRDGAMWRYTRDTRLFGSLATPAIPMHTEAA